MPLIPPLIEEYAEIPCAAFNEPDLKQLVTCLNILILKAGLRWP